MALSGSFYTNVNSYWRLQLEWSATQNIANNTSTVTTKLYWMGLSGRGATYSSASKSGSSTIDGTASSFTGTAKLGNGDKVLIKTHSKTISHASNGTKSFSMSAYFDVNLTLSGTYYGRVSVSGSGTLNTIPRASSLTSSASWTAGENRSFSVSRASSSFDHTIKMYVSGTLVKTISGVGSSGSSNFTVAENTSIFNLINGGSSAAVKIDLHTYSGSSLVGSESYTGTVTAPARSTTSFGGSFNIGDTMNGNISQQNSAFTHTIQLLFGGSTFTLHNKTTASSWSYNTSAIASSLYNLTKTSNRISGKIRLYTYYNGVQIRDYAESSLDAIVTNSKPTFSATGISYVDTNSVTKAITGDAQQIVQKLSNLSVTVGTAAGGVNGATISRYEVLVNGEMKPLTAIGTVTFAEVNAESNITMRVRAIDSRGNYTDASKTIQIIPYKAPVLTAVAARENGFDAATTILSSGSISPLEINKVKKNAVSSIAFRHKLATAADSTFTAWSNLSVVNTGNNFNSSSRVLQFDNTKSYKIEFRVIDKFSTTIISKTVAVGRPIWFIDSVMKSVAFNDFPKFPGEFRLNGRLVFGANTWASNSDFFGAIDMSNSDIVNLNGIYMNDISENAGEGINFLKSGRPEKSPSSTDYDTFRVLDGDMYLDNKRVHMTSDRVLWTGAMFMADTHTITPRIPIHDCPNGWILVWSRYVNGAAAGSDWNYIYVPKEYSEVSGNAGFWNALVAAGVADSVAPPVAYKYMYPRGSTLIGHSRNRTGTETGQVLRCVLSY